MSDQEDGDVGVALGVVFGVIALVIALVIGVAVYKSNSSVTPEVVAVAGEEAYSDVVEVGEPLTKVYFGLGETTLPANVEEEITKIKAAFDAKAGLSVLLSGFHDETGAAAVNTEVAKKRAMSAKAALVAAGIPAEHILMKKPAVTLGGTDAAEARRVEVRVQ